MIEAKRKRIVYGVFLLAVLWGLYMQPWKRRARHRPEPAPAASMDPAAPSATVTSPLADFASISSVADWTIDPFRPTAPVGADDPEGPPIAPNTPVLQGTMMVRGEEVCVIDGQVCKAGDRSGSWRIVQINNGEVTLAGPNQERVTLNAHDGQRK